MSYFLIIYKFDQEGQLIIDDTPNQSSFNIFLLRMGARFDGYCSLMEKLLKNVRNVNFDGKHSENDDLPENHP